MTGPIVRVDKVSRRFAPSLSLGERIAGFFGAPVDDRTVHAVDRVSLSIAPGEVLGLVGESGCGKSTTARTVIGLHRATSGSVRFEDRKSVV